MVAPEEPLKVVTPVLEVRYNPLLVHWEILGEAKLETVRALVDVVIYPGFVKRSVPVAETDKGPLVWKVLEATPPKEMVEMKALV